MSNNMLSIFVNATINKQSYYQMVQDLQKFGKTVRIPIEIDKKALDKSLLSFTNISDATGTLRTNIQKYNIGLGKTVEITSKWSDETEKLEVALSKVNVNQKEIDRTKAKSLSDVQKYYKSEQDAIQKNIRLRQKEIEQIKEKVATRLDNGTASDEKQLNYEIQLRRKMQDETKKANEQNLQDIKNIELYKQKMQNSLSRLQIGKETIFNRNDIKKEVDSFTSDLNRLGEVGGKSTKEVSAQFDNLKTRIAQSSAQFKNVNKDGYDMIQMLELATKKVAIWFAATGGVYFFINQFQSAITYVSNLDNALNEIRIVTNQSQADVNALANSYNELGKEMNVTTSEIAKTAVELYRQGLAQGDVDERLKSIIQYAKISGIELEESNKIITATMNSMGTSAQKTIDIMALLGDISASGPEEIGEGMQKAGASMASLNVSLEKTASWFATISSQTREGASVIGNALKSIATRYTSIREKGFNEEDATNINMVTKALTSAGVVAVDTDGQLRNFADTMDDLGNRWSSLDDKTKNYVATQMAGVYQANRFKALMNQYGQSMEYYEKALNSAGTAEQKFAIYQESMQAKIDNFKTSLEGLYQDTLNSGFSKALVALGTGFIGLIDKIGLVNVSLTVFGGYIGTKFLPIIPGLTNALVNLGTSLVGIGVSANIAATAMSALNIALPILALTAVIALFNKFYVSAEEQKQKVSELTTEFNKLQKTLDEYKGIKNKTEQQKEYIALLEQELAIKQKILKNEKETEAKKVVFGDDTLTKGIQGNTVAAMDKLRYLQNTENSMQKILKFDSDNTGAIESIKNLKNGYLEVQNVLLESKRTVEDYMKSLGNNAPKELRDRLQAYSDELTVSIGYVQTLTGFTNANTQAQNANAKANQDNASSIENQQQALEKLAKTISDSISNMEMLKNAQKEYAENGKLSFDTISSLISKYPELIGYLNDQGSVMEFIKKKDIEEQNTFANAIGQKILISQDANKIHVNLTSDLVNVLRQYYGDDVNNWRTFNNLKLAANTLLINALGQQWSQYYSSQQQALGAMISDPDAFIMSKATKNANGQMQITQGTLDQLNQAQALYKAFGQAANQAGKATLKNYNLGSGSGSGKSSKSGGSSGGSKAVASVAEAIIESDRYSKLNNELEHYNVLLEKNNAIQSTADNKYKNALLKQEISLLQQKEKQLNAINNERREERAELQKTLSAQGVKFSGTGDSLTAINAYAVVQAKLDQVNAHRNDKNKTTYNNLKAQYDALTKSVTRFIEIQNKEIPQASSDWYGLAKDISSVREEIDKIVDDAFSSYQDYLVQSVQDEISSLEKEKQALQDNNDELKIEEERKQKLLDIEKKREEIANLENERNVRLYANGQWNWVADPRALREANDELDSMNEDYNSWEKDQAEQEEIDSYDKRIEKLQDFIDNSKIEYDEEKKQIKSYTELIQSLSGIEQNVYADRLKELQNFVTQRNKLLGISSLNSNSSTSNSSNKATATIPGIGDVGITIKNGKTQTQGLPEGTIIHTGGGDYKIIGGTGGNYTNVKVPTLTTNNNTNNSKSSVVNINIAKVVANTASDLIKYAKQKASVLS